MKKKNPAPEEKLTGERVADTIFLCPDGTYRWIYEFPMLRNPAVLLTVWKIFGALVLAQIAFSFLLALFEGSVESWVTGYLLSPGILIVPGILFALSLVGYLMVAARYGWKYLVLFEMDEEKILHIQLPRQFEKAKAMARLTALAGLAAGSPGAAGAGLLASSRDRSVSEYRLVRRLIGRRRLHLIRVNGRLERNQIYAEGADYDFVWAYLAARCGNAKQSPSR